MSEPQSSAEQPVAGEAVCFTAGTSGAVFALGTIHAWLAADRQPPKVVAGISAGALSAAAFQKAYRELAALDPALNPSANLTEDDRESARWRWFRTYLDAVSRTSLGVLWKAFPDPVDFFADQPPVRDRSRPELLKHEERAARLHYYRLTKLGIWLGGLPIRLSTVVRYLTHYVRARENYAGGAWQWLPMIWQGVKAGALLLVYIARKPLFIAEWRFRDEGDPATSAFSPLLGWKTWLTAMSQLISFSVFLFTGYEWIKRGGTVHGILAALALLIMSAIGWLIIHGFISLLSLRPLTGRDQALGISLLRALDIEKGLISDYELHRWLLELFGETAPGGDLQDCPIHSTPMDLVIVAASLQGIVRGGGTGHRFEAVATAGKESLVNALRAALAIPGLFVPYEANPENWGTTPDQIMGAKTLHLVDGAVFRQNPLPRLISWLGQPGRPQVDTVRLIYNVPIEPRAEPLHRESVNIFEAFSESQRLERRRDTRQQARQINFLSHLSEATGAAATASGRKFVRLNVTEIAPDDDITFRNFIAPTREETLTHAATGCRRTLEELYGPAQAAAGVAESSCRAFLVTIAPGRMKALQSGTPGLPELCARCTGHLTFRVPRGPGEADPGVERAFGTLLRTAEVRLHDLNQGYERLNGSRPAIVVLASGGVFRGATHIGFISALVAAGVKPDLVVGASVGALMGATLCALTDMPVEQQRERVRSLAGLFLDVDDRAALTRQLKNALKQMGIRGRRITLSPASVKRTIGKGTVSSPGFAATGAPPALIDAISHLFMIPHLETASIASQFVAGHFSEAIKRFWDQVQIETLPKLGIERAAMGTSLLGPEARKLMLPATGDDAVWQSRTQPYAWSRFFCTTSDINRGAAMLLGRDTLRLTAAYDFLEACLSSSAFPVVFAPRPESSVLPGTGRPDVLFADGGMFDNLPFFPAIEILTQVQIERTQTLTSPDEVVADLRRRNDHRHLIIAAALDAEPGAEYDDVHANVNRIHQRAEALSTQVKSEEFERSAQIVGKQITEFLAGDPCGEVAANPAAAAILNATIIADVMRVVPSDAGHINPTYAFCRTLGLREERLRKSIANGCFRTLLTMGYQPNPLLPVIATNSKPDIKTSQCVHFLRDSLKIECPFASGKETAAIRTACAADKVQLDELRKFSELSKS